MLLLSLSFAVLITAFTACLLLVPFVIEMAKSRFLLDIPDGRKQHREAVPSFGGIAVFISTVFSFFLWSDLRGSEEVILTFLGMSALFFMGLIDDLIELGAWKKITIQLIISLIIAFGGIKITHLHGILGVEEIPVYIQYLMTVFFILCLTNAYNLIDGIDGLAGGIGLITAFGFGVLFYILGITSYSLIAFALVGSLMGFLRFNLQPAKIFMGDTGSMSVGVLLSIMAIQLLEASSDLSGYVEINSFFPAFVIALFIVPLLDVGQVMLVRIIHGHSPFRPDTRHIHYMLLRRGMSHGEATLTLYGSTLVFIGIFTVGFWLELPHIPILCIALSIAALCIFILYLEDRRFF